MARNADARLLRARAGDAEAREELIAAYTPFVLRVAARAAGRFLVPGRDDEVSVALVAFNEAIDRYDDEAGAAFLTFAEMVIRRRLADHYRRARRVREVPLGEFEAEDEEGEAFNPAEVEAALRAHARREEEEARRADVLRFRALLAEYGLSLEDLVRESPRHEDARRRAMRVAKVVAETPAFASYLRRRKALPLAELARVPGIGVGRKTLERQRRYIVAIALVLMEGLDSLREYVKA
ncbi:MAG: RNA polymerase sigma-I factor [Clostridia bacterium]|nr:RNA polymerase sigma-I factor [Clostridia bacterium]